MPAALVLLTVLTAVVQPQPLKEGRVERGRLDKGEAAYFTIALEPGRYVASLEFTSTSGGGMTIDGGVLLVDDEGNELAPLVALKGLGANAASIATFSVDRPETLTVKVLNRGGPFSEYYRMDFAVQIRREAR
jgi:hypothetical protein